MFALDHVGSFVGLAVDGSIVGLEVAGANVGACVGLVVVGNSLDGACDEVVS